MMDRPLRMPGDHCMWCVEPSNMPCQLDCRKPPMTDRSVETIARLFHDTYERLAPDFGYRTREASAKPWEEVPEQNRALMCATVTEVMDVLRAAHSEAGSEEAERVTLAEALRWLRNEDPSALKGYWPALHALEDHFGVAPAPALRAAARGRSRDDA